MSEILPSVVKSTAMSTLISPNHDRIFTGYLNGHMIEWSLPSNGKDKMSAVKYVSNAHGPALLDDRTQLEQISSDMADMRMKIDRGMRDKQDAICTISAIVYVPDEKGDRIVTGGADGAVCCWDAPSSNQIGWAVGENSPSKTLKRVSSKSPVRSKSPVPSKSTSPNRASVKDRGKSPPRSSRSDAMNLPGMTLLKELGMHKGAVTSLVVMKMKKEVLVVSAGVDTLVKVWSMDTQTLKQTLRGHTDRVWCLGAFSSCPFLLSGGLDSTMRVYELGKNFTHVKTLKGHKAPVKSIKVTHLPLMSKYVAVSGSEDCTMRIYSLGEAISLMISIDLTLPISTLEAIPAVGGGLFIIAGNDDGFSHGGLEVWGVGKLTESTPYSAEDNTMFEGGAKYMGTLTTSGLVPLSQEERKLKASAAPRTNTRAGGDVAVVALAALAYSEDKCVGSTLETSAAEGDDTSVGPKHGEVLLDKTTVVACDREGRVRVWRSLNWQILTTPNAVLPEPTTDSPEEVVVSEVDEALMSNNEAMAPASPTCTIPMKTAATSSSTVQGLFSPVGVPTSDHTVIQWTPPRPPSSDAPDWIMMPIDSPSSKTSDPNSEQTGFDSSAIVLSQETVEEGEEENDQETDLNQEDVLLESEGWTKVEHDGTELWVVVGEPELSQLERPKLGLLDTLRKMRDEAQAAKAEAKALKKKQKALEKLRMEEEAKLKAEEEAKQKEQEEAKLKVEEEAKQKAQEEAKLKAEEEAKQKEQEEAKLKAEEEAKQQAQEEAKLKSEAHSRRLEETLEAEAKLREEADAAEASMRARSMAQQARLQAELEAEELRLEQELVLAQQRLKDKVAAHEARLKQEAEEVEQQLLQQAKEAESRLREAKLKAEQEQAEVAKKLEADDTLRAEREAKDRADKEAFLIAEQEAIAAQVALKEARAEEASRLRAQQLAQARAEEETRLKAEHLSGKFVACDCFRTDVTAVAGTCVCGNMKAEHSPWAMKNKKPSGGGGGGGGVGAKVQALTEYIAELDRKDLEAGGTGQSHKYKPLGHRMEPMIPMAKLDPWAHGNV